MLIRFKNNIISFFTFLAMLILPLSSSVMINHALTSQTVADMERGFFGKNTYSLAIKNDGFSIKDLLKYTDNNYNFAVYHDYDENIREIFYTNKFAYFPMLSGRFFNGEDFASRENYAVIGKKHEKDIFKKNNKQYISVNGEDYQVLGVFGTDTDTVFDNKILTSNKVKGDNKSVIFYIDCFFNDSDNFINSVLENLQASGIKAEPISTEQSVLSGIIPDFLYSRWFGMLIICQLICVILLTFEWINTKKKEIAVKRLLGHSSAAIMISTCSGYILNAASAFIIGLILSCFAYPQHTQYIKPFAAVIAPIAAAVLFSCYSCVKNVSVEEAIK